MRLGRLQVALVTRASRSTRRLVMPTGWRERQALERLEARGLASWGLGLPDVWRVEVSRDG